jgi:hypothetical protein
LGNSSDGIAFAQDFINASTNGTGPIDSVVGGVQPGAGNTIAFNGRHGVNILAGTRIGILSNSIFSNAQLGIDLNGNSVTANDAGDADAGENELQNYPVLTSAVTDGVRTSVTGTLNTAPNTAFLLQFFANTAAEPTGFGEGRTLLGSRTISTDPAGNVSFTLIFPVPMPVGQWVSATATDPTNNTSEFARSVQVPAGEVGPNQPPTASAGGPYLIDEGSPLALSAARSLDPDGDPLSFSWDVNNDGTFGDASGVSPTLSWAQLGALGITNGPASSVVRVRVDDGQGHVTTSAASDLTVRNVAPLPDAGLDRVIVEGDAVSLTGTFTDPGPLDTQTVQWSVVAENGQQIAGGTGATFEFVTADNGNYAVTFTVTDSDGGVGSRTVNVFAVNTPPTGPILGLPAQGRVGAPLNLSVSPVDPSPIDTAAGFGYRWNVYLNDQPVSEGNDRDFSFTPAASGTYTIDLRISDKDFAESFVTTELAVVESPAVAPVVVTGPDATLDEGDTYAAPGFYVDADPADAWTATVDYGDGKQPLALKADKTFDLSHKFDDNGTFEVVVEVTDSAGLVGTAMARVTVNNVNPAVTLADPAAVTVGEAFTVAGSFTDPGADTWTATVNYGDGAGEVPLAVAPDGDFTLNHAYQRAGSFPVTVTVTDDDGGAGSATRTAVVNRLQAALAVAPASGTYGGVTTLSATLTAGGLPLAGAAVVFRINDVTVGSATTDASGTATLADVSLPGLSAGPATVLASFAEDERHTAAAGSATLTIARAPLLVVVGNHTRVYGQDNPVLGGTISGIQNGDDIGAIYSTGAGNTSAVGNYAVTATLTDPAGRLANYDVSVRDGTLTVTTTTLTTAGTAIAATAGTAFSGVVATFTTDNPIAAASDFTAAIDWGDGQTSPAAVRASAGGFEVVGDHTYAAGGTYPVTASIRDNAGLGSASAVSHAVVTAVANSAPAVTITGPAAGAVFAVNTTVMLTGAFTDPDAGDSHAALWSITAPGQPTITVPGVVHPDGRVTATYAFAAAGTYHVALTVTDSAGASGTATTVGGADARVVVFDAAAGKVTGGGWFDSPTGAASNPAYSGRANFGFNAQYRERDSVPTGQLQFNVGGLIFHSTAIDWLVVRGAKAQFSGTGSIGGRGTYAFVVTLIDGRRAGGPDRFGIRIWDPATGAVIYDNGVGADDTESSLTPLGGGNTTIHR